MLCLQKDKPHWSPLPWCAVLQLQIIWPLHPRLPWQNPSGTPHHHNRLHSWPWYDHNHRDRSQSINYRHGHRRCFDWSHHWSHHNRSSGNYWRQASDSPSNHCSSLCCPLTVWHPRIHHTGITATHLVCATFANRLPFKVIPQTKADLVQATITIVLEDHTQRKWQNHTQEQQPLINPTTRRRSSFMIHK